MVVRSGKPPKSFGGGPRGATLGWDAGASWTMAAETQAGRVLWRAVVCVLAATAWPGTAGAAEPVRSIAEILALPLDELHSRRPVVVRGVVTLLVPLVIQDGEFGIRVNPPGADPGRPSPEQLAGLPLALGAEVEVSGAVGPGRYAPEISMHTVRGLGARPLPEPEPLEISRLFAGGQVGRRVRATGVVQAVLDNPEGWSLVVESAARRFRVIVKKHLLPARPDDWIDAEAEIVGVGNAYRNSRGEFLAPGLEVAKAEDIRVVLAPSLGGFELPLTPLNGIARYRSQPRAGHRLRTKGVVSFAVPGLLYVQEGIGGVRVELAPGPEAAAVFQPGDQIEVAGFPDVSRGIGGLAWAVARKISAGHAPAPVAIQPGEIQRLDDTVLRAAEIAQEGSHDGCLIRCRGRIEAVRRSAAGPVLYLLDQGVAFTTTFAGEHDPGPAPFILGSDVEVTGIVQTLRRNLHAEGLTRGAGRIAQIELLVRGAGDIRVVRLPPWWTPWRLGAAAATAAALVIASFAWVTMLRREVDRQTSRALAEEAARVKAAMDYEITLRERNRLAANLHDTLLQTLGGIGFQLDACEGSRGRDEAEAKMHFDVARRMVNHATTELHSSVWAMRSLPIRDRTFPEALRTLADRVAEGHAALVDVRTTGDLDHVPEFVAGHVLLIIQEALYNALRHGRPSRVEIRVHGDASTRAVDILVHDDGRGFGTGALPGMDQGHFGVQGMRERAERLGGWLKIESAEGQGTTVHARVVGHEREEAKDGAASIT
jgi:signal transduction histidine kinase